jgi:hypothetical protein
MKLTLTQKVKRATYHSINGVRSGIPLCCTIHFVKLDWDGIKRIARSECERRGFSWHHDPARPKFDIEAEYCLCDKCFDNSRSKGIKKNGTIFKNLIKRGRVK